MTIDVTKMTSRGQVVIPQEIRKEVHAKEGEKFLVYAIDEGIILKKVGGLVPEILLTALRSHFSLSGELPKKEN
ncbi:MAG TPA: AbrB/MazE/SpoVT family DNA-binding domain-containing protein [Candidatus Nanoarchaeia archaeon]|nr:AbrB/MazE/SpoVT family DNA-binding domain-containing protein [Candidatus Nanoarchaeia archaeon]